MKEDEVVGHIPYYLSPIVSQFLRRDVNTAFVQVIGEKVNRGARGAGYGLEVPCLYKFFGPKAYMYIDKLREVVNSLQSSGLA